MDHLATDWLQKAETYTYDVTEPAKAPILWYKFNESGSTVNAVDYGTGDPNNYEGTISGFIPQNWKVGGGRNGDNCLYLPQGSGCYVDAPVAASPGFNALGFMGDTAHQDNTAGISFSVWINADLTSNAFQVQWNGLFGVWNADANNETLEIHCPSHLNLPLGTTTGTVDFIKKIPHIDWPVHDGTTAGGVTVETWDLPLSDFGGRWNHWAFVKDATEMLVYCNGNLVGDINSLDPGASTTAQPLFPAGVGALRIGTRGTNWGGWNGYMQDFQVYDYTLSAAEVAYLATDGTGEIFVPLVSPANINLTTDYQQTKTRLSTSVIWL